MKLENATVIKNDFPFLTFEPGETAQISNVLFRQLNWLDRLATRWWRWTSRNKRHALEIDARMRSLTRRTP